MKNIKSLITFVSTIMAGRTALARIRQAREDGMGVQPWGAVSAVVRRAWT